MITMCFMLLITWFTSSIDYSYIYTTPTPFCVCTTENVRYTSDFTSLRGIKQERRYVYVCVTSMVTVGVCVYVYSAVQTNYSRPTQTPWCRRVDEG